MRDFSNPDALFLLSQGALLLDIRTRKEYCQGHIKGAILVPTPPPPLNEREEQTLNDLLWWNVSHHTKSKQNPIVIYCRKGVRARLAKKIIIGMGYPNVVAWGGVEEPPLKQFFVENKLVCRHASEEL